MKEEIIRCAWAHGKLLQDYHDTQWGVPVHSDQKHFEFLLLEGAQAGLSWSIILKRREDYRKAFAGFDPNKVAKFTEKDIKNLLRDEGIIRNKLKVRSAINNAKRFLEVQKEFESFDNYIWQFVGGKPIVNSWKDISEIPVKTKESKNLSQDLKERGFSFVGPTIIYALIQATGLVNDHTINCFRYPQLR
jgi:DNA-3-methyladenine glycosylase I